MVANRRGYDLFPRALAGTKSLLNTAGTAIIRAAQAQAVLNGPHSQKKRSCAGCEPYVARRCLVSLFADPTKLDHMNYHKSRQQQKFQPSDYNKR
jgi:hypothetical protein